MNKLLQSVTIVGHSEDEISHNKWSENVFSLPILITILTISNVYKHYYLSYSLQPLIATHNHLMWFTH